MSLSEAPYVRIYHLIHSLLLEHPRRVSSSPALAFPLPCPMNPLCLRSISASPHSHLSPPVTVENLQLALRLRRLGYSADYIAEFVTGEWSAHATGPHPLEAPCAALCLPARFSSCGTARA